ncbi:UNVERIFIED_CONTAM: hypothetical protein GTU68_006290 [Idotea baltica]|nr:hypothetical protein [Idotea baltica]
METETARETESSNPPPPKIFLAKGREEIR